MCSLTLTKHSRFLHLILVYDIFKRLNLVSKSVKTFWILIEKKLFVWLIWSDFYQIIRVSFCEGWIKFSSPLDFTGKKSFKTSKQCSDCFFFCLFCSEKNRKKLNNCCKVSVLLCFNPMLTIMYVWGSNKKRKYDILSTSNFRAIVLYKFSNPIN